MGRGGGDIQGVYIRGFGGGREGGVCFFVVNLFESSHIIQYFSCLQILPIIVGSGS